MDRRLYGCLICSFFSFFLAVLATAIACKIIYGSGRREAIYVEFYPKPVIHEGRRPA